MCMFAIFGKAFETSGLIGLVLHIIAPQLMLITKTLVLLLQDHLETLMGSVVST